MVEFVRQALPIGLEVFNFFCNLDKPLFNEVFRAFQKFVKDF